MVTNRPQRPDSLPKLFTLLLIMVVSSAKSPRESADNGGGDSVGVFEDDKLLKWNKNIFTWCMAVEV